MNIHKICPNPSLYKFNICRLWHDNSGTSPSWFVNYIVVRDLQRDEKFYFVCQRWLAVDKEDGKVCFIYYCNIKNCAYRDSNSELSFSSQVLCRILHFWPRPLCTSICEMYLYSSITLFIVLGGHIVGGTNVKTKNLTKTGGAVPTSFYAFYACVILNCFTVF